MAENTVSFPDLALDKFSGNDPDQDAKSFLLTVEKKSTFRLDQDQLTMQKEHDIYSERKHYFLHFFEDQQQNGMQTQSPTQKLGTRSEPPSSTDFQMIETSTDTESGQRIVCEATKN